MMNKKKLVMLVGILGIFIFSNMLVSAVCCEKLDNGGAWCQVADDESACDNQYNIFDTQFCDAASVPECSGVCVSEQTGECSENTPQFKCTEELNGVWHEESIENIPECQNVCCVMGIQTVFATPTECRQMFSDLGFQGQIRDDVTDRDACDALATSFKEGACVIETDLENTCIRTTEIGCNDLKNNLSELLQYSYSQGEVYIHWDEGFLCSGSREVNGQTEYISSGCTKSPDTMCEDGKVYYVDTCGNKANIYDASKYNSLDYWTHIYDSSDEENVCQINGASSTCGNCDTILSSTVCQNFKDAVNNNGGNMAAPANNKDGLVCGSLNCNLPNGDIKTHGESWCGGTAGTLLPIKYNFSVGELMQSSRNELEKNYNDYNVPGSRYYKSICSFGEILVEECSDYRNEFCAEEETDGRSFGNCVTNTWRFCFDYTTKTNCEESTKLCKWVPGYRWDATIVNEKSEGRRMEEQGSCVPLIAPGFDFWQGNTQAVPICERATVQEYALYETTWWIDREDFAGWGDKTQSHACLNGCYAIPKYGTIDEEDISKVKKCDEGNDCSSDEICFTGYCVDKELFNFYDESEYALGENIKNYYLSARRGQYCHKDGKPDKWLTGGDPNLDHYDCTPYGGGEGKDEDKERDFPIFLTHKTWLDSIMERTRSIGDCGFKVGASGIESSPETEIVTAIFEKLKQNQEVKEKITAEMIIYKGEKDGLKWVGDDEEPYNEGLYDVVEYTCAENGGSCTAELNQRGNENCPGEKIEGENLCAAGMVCCAYTELE
jgi:hypothetical protein